MLHKIVEAKAVQIAFLIILVDIISFPIENAASLQDEINLSTKTTDTTESLRELVQRPTAGNGESITGQRHSYILV